MLFRNAENLKIKIEIIRAVASHLGALMQVVISRNFVVIKLI